MIEAGTIGITAVWDDAQARQDADAFIKQYSGQSLNLSPAFGNQPQTGTSGTPQPGNSGSSASASFSSFTSSLASMTTAVNNVISALGSFATALDRAGGTTGPRSAGVGNVGNAQGSGPLGAGANPVSASASAGTGAAGQSGSGPSGAGANPYILAAMAGTSGSAAASAAAASTGIAGQRAFAGVAGVIPTNFAGYAGGNTYTWGNPAAVAGVGTGGLGGGGGGPGGGGGGPGGVGQPGNFNYVRPNPNNGGYRENRRFILNAYAAGFAIRGISEARDAMNLSEREDRGMMFGTNEETVASQLARVRQQGEGIGGLFRRVAASDIGHAIWSATGEKILGGYNAADFNDQQNEKDLEEQQRKASAAASSVSLRRQAGAVSRFTSLIGLGGHGLQMQTSILASTQADIDDQLRQKQWQNQTTPEAIAASAQSRSLRDADIGRQNQMQRQIMGDSSFSVFMAQSAAHSASGNSRQESIDEVYRTMADQVRHDKGFSQLQRDDERRGFADIGKINAQYDKEARLNAQHMGFQHYADLSVINGASPLERSRAANKAAAASAMLDAASEGKDTDDVVIGIDQHRKDMDAMAERDYQYNLWNRSVSQGMNIASLGLLLNNNPLGARNSNVLGSAVQEIGKQFHEGTESPGSIFNVLKQAAMEVAVNNKNFGFESSQIDIGQTARYRALSILKADPRNVVGAQLAGFVGEEQQRVNEFLFQDRRPEAGAEYRNALLQVSVQKQQYLNGFGFNGTDLRTTDTSKFNQNTIDLNKVLSEFQKAQAALIADAIKDGFKQVVDQGGN
jgi:hypothetical protein